MSGHSQFFNYTWRVVVFSGWQIRCQLYTYFFDQQQQFGPTLPLMVKQSVRFFPSLNSPSKALVITKQFFIIFQQQMKKRVFISASFVRCLVSDQVLYLETILKCF
eukprot:TRINITY_DN4434_c1_g1_i4.p5 TRINITY_DN4434_c1_g1~~TRINITY_DN4434_c1_g1_i4.p5  ORF type:complete len:106 (-),score=2.12 TRINITY_DN4434_c1_g1_i4:376-693(-)